MMKVGVCTVEEIRRSRQGFVNDFCGMKSREEDESIRSWLFASPGGIPASFGFQFRLTDSTKLMDGHNDPRA